MKDKITRFTQPERYFHNTVMVTFTLLLATGLAMLYYNLAGQRMGTREYIVLAHEVIAVLFIAVPLFILAFSAKKVWKENLNVMTSWRPADLRWLIKKPVSALFRRNVKLPDSDKFNPGQKMWAIVAVVSVLALSITGVILWVASSAIAALFIHTAISMMMVFGLAGHVFMAVCNSDTKEGFCSITHGKVDAKWAKNHHALWYNRLVKESLYKTAPIDSLAALSPANDTVATDNNVYVGASLTNTN